MVKTENLTKQYGDLIAVNRLNLHLEKGDIFGFIGPNGAGKTTTINILATLLTPTSGKAFVGGIDVVKEPNEVRKIVGYMPEFFGVYDDMTVWEYLDFFAAAFNVPAKRRRRIIDDVLALTDLSSKSNFFVETLSRGMRQRLCLAKTLVHDPLVLLLDEPASGLDPRARIEVRELLKELRRMGKTILVSSHILSELADFCNKIGIIERGELLASGQVDEILANIKRQRTLKITLLNGSELRKAENLISALKGIEDIRAKNKTIEFEFDGDDELLANILENLVRDGVKVIAFCEKDTNLEEVFMRITRGDVA